MVKLSHLNLVLLLTLWIGSCSLGPNMVPATPRITSVAASPDLAFHSEKWEREVQRRYTEAVVVFAHGSDVGDEWWVNTPFGLKSVEALIEGLREDIPEQRIVLIVCNPEGHELDAPGVTYARQTVWAVPDDEESWNNAAVRDLGQPEVVGSIFEFTHNP